MSLFAEFGFTSDDGLRLSGRLYGTLSPDALPLVCLPGLTRNARDFHRFAEIVTQTPDAPPVIALDYRGRGRSAWAADAATYTVLQEAKDVLAALAHLGVGRGVFVGTSRGALVIHMLALLAPGALAAAVLNDAGPRIEAEGLRLIRNALRQSAPLPDWPAAIDHVAATYAPSFPALGQANFERMARALYRESEDGIIADYDPRLTEQMALLDFDQPLPELWQAFEALRAVPVMVIRGERSRLLAAETVLRMQALHPDLVAVEVAGQGHAPMLETGGLPGLIMEFVERAKTSASV